MRTLPAVRGAALAAAAATIALTGCTSHAASDHHAIVPAARASLPAGTAATGGWHGVTLIGPAAQAWTSQFAATAADDSWSTWQPCSSCQGTAPRVERWNGHAWATVPLPHRLATAAAAAVAVGASSASNAWLVAPGQVVRWNGGSWQAEPIPSWAVLGSAGVYKVAAAVFGPASAWLFSLDRNASPTPYYAARDDGGRWSKVPLPGAPEAVSALAPDDIWVLGATRASAATNNPSVILMHWNGTRWATVTAPTVRVPDRASVDNADLVATGPHDAWLVRQTQKPNSEGEPVAAGASLLHWNGTSWSTVAIPVPAQTSVVAMAQDGTGGLWLATAGAGPAATQAFYHHTAAGWDKAAVPGTQTTVNGGTRVTVTGLTWVPGTSTLWASASLLTGNGTGATPVAGLILGQDH